MMSSNVNDAASAPAALSAFLRGVERRGALFAELQCGDRDAGDDALAAAMRAFRNHAGPLPMAEWPRRFWTLLAATPQLRQSAPMAQWPAGVGMLAGLQPLPRQALLLRLAASLPEPEAAAVLGIAPEAHRQALASACPRDASGQPDASGWRTLAEAIQSLLRDLPPQRLARLARLREAALVGARLERPAPATPPATPAAARPRSRRWPWVVLVLMFCAAALAATWWWPQRQASPGAVAPLQGGAQRLQDEVEIIREDLPVQPPAAKFDAATAVLTHPDFELILEPQDETIARDADFLAWYAAGASAPLDAPEEKAEAEPAAMAMRAAPVSAPGARTTPQGALAQSQRQARLQAMTPGQRAQFGQRLAAWNALPLSEREERRARYQAWLQLEVGERESLGALAAQLDAFAPQRKQALRAQFDALDDVQRRGWRLGPVLGPDYPALHPLLAYVSAPQRLPLLTRLRNLDARQRADLAVLAQRTPPQDRQALRSELLSVPPAQVAAWLRGKLDQ